MPQVFSLSSHQEGMLATALGICTPTNYANSIGHKSEPFTTMEAANTASVEVVVIEVVKAEITCQHIFFYLLIIS